MRPWTRSLARALGALLALLLGSLVVIATAETAAWTVLGISWAAAPEIEGVLMIWFGLLGAAWGIHQRIHLAVEVLTARLPERPRVLLGRLAAALVAVFGGLLAFYGARLAAAVTNTLPATGIAASVQYFPAAVSGVLMAVFALEEALSGDPVRKADPR